MDASKYPPMPYTFDAKNEIIRDCNGEDIADFFRMDDDSKVAATGILFKASPSLLKACVSFLATWGSEDEDAIIASFNLAKEAVASATEIESSPGRIQP